MRLLQRMPRFHSERSRRIQGSGFRGRDSGARSQKSGVRSQEHEVNFMSTRCCRWIFVFCFSLVSGFAQQVGPAGQSEPPAFVPPGSANHRMTLDVVVTDKSGRPLPGLQQQDFTLLDNEQPQRIVSFHAVERGTATPDPPVEVILLVDEVNTSYTNVAFERKEIE